MFNRFQRTLYFGFCLALLATGCDRGPEGPEESGSLAGYVALVSANGSQAAVRDSVQVTVLETHQNAFTDSSGKWMIPELKTGTYTISFTKAGFGTSKSVQFQFTGGNEKNLGTTFLCAAPAFSVANLAALGVSTARTDSASIYFGVALTDSTITAPYRVYLVLSTDTNVSATPTLHSFGNFYNLNFIRGLDSTDIRLTPANIATAGFAPGDTLYAAAYAANAGANNSGYLDTLTGKTLFTNVNVARSNTVKVVVPSFSAQTLAGSLSGFVTLVKANGDQPAQRDSVWVSVEGTSFATWTDSSGSWTFPNLKNGTYTLSFAKTGFGSVKTNVNQTNGANKNIGTTTLCEVPAFSIGDLSQLAYNANRNDSASVYLGARLSDTTITGEYRVYLVVSMSADVSSAPNVYAQGNFFPAYFKKGTSNADLRLTPAFLATGGYESGDTLYAKAYAANAGSNNSSYPDSLTGKPVYTNLNSTGSNTLKFVVP